MGTHLMKDVADSAAAWVATVRVASCQDFGLGQKGEHSCPMAHMQSQTSLTNGCRAEASSGLLQGAVVRYSNKALARRKNRTKKTAFCSCAGLRLARAVL